MDAMTLGAFSIDRRGGLRPRAPDRRPRLRFAWRGRRCEAELTEGGVRLGALAGRIPSTADPLADRPAAFATLADLPGRLPPTWRLRLLPDHRIRIEAEDVLADGSPTAISIIVAMVRFALALDPYLDALDSGGAGARPNAPAGTTAGLATAGAPGTAKT